MSRRLGLLAVLLLCLAGFAPSIWACAAMEQQHQDCCPPGQPPCGKPPLSTGVTETACCSAQVAPTQQVASLVKVKGQVLGGAPPTYGWQGIASVSKVDRATAVRSSINSDLRPENNQQQLYLQTGRLRL
jgi:hypothetical protein